MKTTVEQLDQTQQDRVKEEQSERPQQDRVISNKRGDSQNATAKQREEPTQDRGKATSGQSDKPH